jgi:hypothetical protein
MEDVDKYGNALPPGSLILGGQYCLDQLIHQRPRVNLYLGRRIFRQDGLNGQSIEESQPLPPVAVRELVLSDVARRIQEVVERAAFEEFVSPAVLGSLRLPCAGDRIRREGDRHYLIMQLGDAKKRARELPLPLFDLLCQEQWPSWLGQRTAVQWSAQLSRIVARLHRSGTFLCELDPATVLVDAKGKAEWSPLLLLSWPPAPTFWSGPAVGGMESRSYYSQVFPIARNTGDSPFAAPELRGGSFDERSDVYSLGAMLYLLLTRYAPAAAFRRLLADQTHVYAGGGRATEPIVMQEQEAFDALALIPPAILNNHIAEPLEQIVLRALSLDPAERFPSAFALAEALESFDQNAA